MKIALYQGPGHINNVPAAYSLMAAKAAEARAHGADLLLLPEMYLSGYNIGPAAARAQALTQAGPDPGAATSPKPTTSRSPSAIRSWWGRTSPIRPRLSGRTARSCSITAKRICSARSTAPCSRRWAPNSPIAELGGVKIGLLICYDIEFPEPARRLGLAGADLLLIPTAQMEPYEQVARHVAARPRL